MPAPATAILPSAPALLQGLPALADADARVLVLGSMPGAESLRRQQYYAHPRNQFWPIVGTLFGIDPALAYDERVQRLRAHGVAVWDVLASCRREGSLDTAIAADSIRVNDFATFFAAQPRLRAVFFNGGFAEATFHRYVLGDGVALPDGVTLARLPSTSPANASLSAATKLAAWRALAAVPG